MTDLSQQTEQLLKAFDGLHRDLSTLHYDLVALGLTAIVLLILIAFRRR